MASGNTNQLPTVSFELLDEGAAIHDSTIHTYTHIARGGLGNSHNRPSLHRWPLGERPKSSAPNGTLDPSRQNQCSQCLHLQEKCRHGSARGGRVGDCYLWERVRGRVTPRHCDVTLRHCDVTRRHIIVTLRHCDVKDCHRRHPIRGSFLGGGDLGSPPPRSQPTPLDPLQGGGSRFTHPPRGGRPDREHNPGRRYLPAGQPNTDKAKPMRTGPPEQKAKIKSTHGHT